MRPSPKMKQLYWTRVDPEQTVMEVPSRLVPAVRELIAKHEDVA